MCADTSEQCSFVHCGENASITVSDVRAHVKLGQLCFQTEKEEREERERVCAHPKSPLLLEYNEQSAAC